jgi:hypothetical protein
MSKYKICKFVNGNDKEWYQIQKRGWLFWSYLSSYQYIGPLDFPPLKTILKFDHIDKAKKYIDMKQDTERYVKNNNFVKRVECFDYE